VGYPKVFERPVGIPADQAFPIVMAFLAERGCRVKRQSPPRRVEAEHGRVFALASEIDAKKLLEIDLVPIPAGTVVRVTMPLSKWYFDDGRLLEGAVTRTWAQFLEPLWWRFGYPPQPL
jgi:hypothetical protein